MIWPYQGQASSSCISGLSCVCTSSQALQHCKGPQQAEGGGPHQCPQGCIQAPTRLSGLDHGGRCCQGKVAPHKLRPAVTLLRTKKVHQETLLEKSEGRQCMRGPDSLIPDSLKMSLLMMSHKSSNRTGHLSSPTSSHCVAGTSFFARSGHTLM